MGPSGLPEPMSINRIHSEPMSEQIDPKPDKEEEVKEEFDGGEALRTYFPETWLWDIIKIGFVNVSAK